MRYFSFVIVYFSCSSKRYSSLQDTKLKTDYKFEFKKFNSSDDILRIKISSKSSDIASLFDAPQNLTRTNFVFSYQIEGFSQFKRLY